MIFKAICVICLLGGISAWIATKDDDEWEAVIRNDLLELMRTRAMSPRLSVALDGIELPLFTSQSRLQGRIFDLERLPCKLCNILISIVWTARKLGFQKPQFMFLFTSVCIWLKIQKEEVCEGLLSRNIDTLLYIIDNRPHLRANHVCSIVFQTLQCRDPLRRKWSLNLPPYPPIAQNSVYNAKENQALRIVQISDIHYDPEYSAGSNADCGSPVCCHKGTVPESDTTAAGHWGDYRDCNPPWHAVVDMLEQVQRQHKDIAYVYFMGDIIAHKVHDTSRRKNTREITKVYTEFKKAFGDTPVYPVLGNHEPHPVNLFSPEDIDPSMEISTHWVFSLVAELWQNWLPPETQETVLRGGYYTLLVRPGFRIIALNSNVCLGYNFWLLYDDYDTYGQLQWLIDTLLNAETHNEKVHILSHVPSGDGTCLSDWGEQYAAIVDRFSHVIAAQFNGHTHADDTVIYYSKLNRSEANNVAFNGGSFTTYSYLNPNYKVYDVDAESMEVTNFESWTYNITDANQSPTLPPKWYKLYDFKSAYNVSSLHPQELSKLAERMAEESALIQLYFRNKYREADPIISKGCDTDCELDSICTMVTATYGDNYHCNLYTQLYWKNRF